MRVKICGIRSVDDALSAVEAGADAIGLVFYEPSPRHIDSFLLAREISLSVGPFVTVVALLVDPELEYVNSLLEAVPVHVLQFHGNESAEFCEQFARPYMKVLRMKKDVDVLAEMHAFPNACGFLLDTYKKGVPGGTGESFDWVKVPLNPPKPLILAGGLSPKNVASAVRIAEPYGVDVSGGVELTPGLKDKDKIRAFVKNAQME